MLLAETIESMLIALDGINFKQFLSLKPKNR